MFMRDVFGILFRKLLERSKINYLGGAHLRDILEIVYEKLENTFFNAYL